MPVKSEEAKIRRREKRRTAAVELARSKGLTEPVKREAKPKFTPNKMTIGRQDPSMAAMSKNELREMFAQAMRNTAEM